MLFGDSDAMRAINKTIHQLRNNDTTSVLIAGETGVGKEVVARAIHAGGPRAPTPFVASKLRSDPLRTRRIRPLRSRPRRIHQCDSRPDRLL